MTEGQTKLKQRKAMKAIPEGTGHRTNAPNIMPRLALAFFLAMGVIISASTPALAKRVVDLSNWGTLELEDVGDEPQAAGQATLTEVVETSWYHSPSGDSSSTYTDVLTIKCRLLMTELALQTRTAIHRIKCAAVMRALWRALSVCRRI